MTFDLARYSELHASSGLKLGAPLRHTEQTGSTNDDALQAAKAGAPHGATFVTEHQTHGRGRRGRTWLAEAGANLLASVLLRTEFPSESVSLIALAAGLSVRAAIERAVQAASRQPSDACRVHIKWPNDVWLDGKKIAGVLCESQVVNGRATAVVVGFGINVGTVSFPDELANRATSLSRAGIGAYPHETLLIDSLSALEGYVTGLLESGPEALAEHLNRYDALLGCEVSVDGTRGVASGIDAQGRLKLRVAPDNMLTLSVGTVEVLTPPSI